MQLDSREAKSPSKSELLFIYLFFCHNWNFRTHAHRVLKPCIMLVLQFLICWSSLYLVSIHVWLSCTLYIKLVYEIHFPSYALSYLLSLWLFDFHSWTFCGQVLKWRKWVLGFPFSYLGKACRNLSFVPISKHDIHRAICFMLGFGCDPFSVCFAQTYILFV